MSEHHINENNTLVIFSESEVDRNFLLNFFKETFGDLLHIIPLTISSCASMTFIPRLVIVTITSREIAPKLFPGSKIIYANRIITGYNLEKIIKLPVNTTALMVNSPKEIAEQTVEDLYSFGIHHLNLIPYWPDSNMDISDYDIVIYSGFRSYCPEGKAVYIDIGHRRVTMAILIEIIKIFNLPAKFMDEQYSGYVKLIINDMYTMNASIEKIVSLQESFEQVINLSAQAIFVIDESKKITIFNPIAEKIFAIESPLAVGQSIFKALQGFPALLELIDVNGKLSEKMVAINDGYFLLSANSIAPSSDTVIQLESVDKLQAAAEKVRTKMHNVGFKAKYSFDDILGDSVPIKKTISMAKYYSKCDGTILILGESGTGKELFAQSIHQASYRSKEAFVAVNFGAIPENLVESELFGYEEGAFTGALKGGKKGLFRVAHKGTIFLDEIGDASLAVQTRLLRVLEEREVTPVGSARTIPIDVRIVCATNKNLEELVSQGKFRNDLYYRIKVLVLTVPSLRARRTDIPIIINSILSASVNVSPCVKIPNHILTRLTQYSWPGNIRELKSLIQNIAMFFNNSDSFEGEYSDVFIDDIINNFIAQDNENETASCHLTSLDYISLSILKEIDRLNQNGAIAGRYSLSKNNTLITLGLTEAKIKTKAKSLEENGFITIGSTKQGMRLTENGRKALVTS